MSTELSKSRFRVLETALKNLYGLYETDSSQRSYNAIITALAPMKLDHNQLKCMMDYIAFRIRGSFDFQGKSYTRKPAANDFCRAFDELSRSNFSVTDAIKKYDSWY